MRIAVGADHAGFDMKGDLLAALRTKGHDVLDLGTYSTAAVDYPDCAEAVATALSDRRADRGLLVCGSGAGVSIAANKFPGIRAAACHDTYTAHQAVELVRTADEPDALARMRGRLRLYQVGRPFREPAEAARN